MILPSLLCPFYYPLSMATVAEIAEMLKAPVRGDGTRQITGAASLTEAGPNDISVLAAETFLKQFADTRAGAVIVHQRIKLSQPAQPAVLIVDDADLAFAKVLQLFAPPIPRPPRGIDPSARIAPSATLGEQCAIGPNVFIGEGSQIGGHCTLHAGVFVGNDVSIGEGCEFFPNVVIRERITIGDRVVIHAGSVLGSDGFGYRWDGKRHVKVPQIGTVIVEDDVEIGSCVCVDRAKSGTTRIGTGTKIDNLVQIAHNCQIGPHCIITGQVGLAGSVTLGSGVVLGGQSAVRDHVTMGDGSMAAARSAVHEDVEPRMIVSGMPALPHRQSLREQAALRHLPDLRMQIRKLQEEIEQLKSERSK